jgi:hypothetical protein
MEADQRPAPRSFSCRCSAVPRTTGRPVGQKLAEANVTALAIDLPGSTLPEDPKQLASWSEQIRAAVSFLASRIREVRPGSIGVAGASLGGTWRHSSRG